MADCDFIPIPHPPVYGAPFVRSTALRTCPVCGEQFTEEGRRGPKAKTSYCSCACRALGNSKDLGNLLRVENGVPVFKCFVCDGEFTGRKRKFCSEPCVDIAKRLRDLQRKNTNYGVVTDKSSGVLLFRCAHCDKEFFGRSKKYCSTECATSARVAQYKSRPKEARIAERARMAEKRGKQYRPGGAAVRAVPFSVLQSRLAKQNASQAWDWWMVNAPDEWVAAYWEATGEPWRNRRLSDTEKYRIQYRLDPVFNLKERLRQQARKQKKRARTGEAIRSTIRRNGRAPSLEKMFGYTIPELKAHLERQFTKRMNWDRFLSGEIHIDHIYPQSKFDLSDDEQWKRCWCLSNLRPLWARDNLEKNNRVLFLV